MAVPILVYSNSAEKANTLAESLRPEYDVVHICTTLTSALSEIPKLVTNRTIKTEMGLGTNAQRAEADRLVPQAVAFGGAIPEEEVQQVIQAVHQEGGAPIFTRVTAEAVKELGGPSPENIATAHRRMLQDAGLEGSVTQNRT